MGESKTALLSKNFYGDQPYQIKARQALPILVRQAWSGQTISYQALARELGMPNPRNLNYPLGSVGQTLIELGKKRGEEIPPIQSLVINQSDRIPGEGFGWFLPNESDWTNLSKSQRRKILDGVNQRIYAYPHWASILRDLSLYSHDPISVKDLEDAALFRGKESQDHIDLKNLVSSRPELVGLPGRTVPGVVEKLLPSGDSIDVFFQARDEWVGVEVKPEFAPSHDLLRGLFQCVKYQAVLRAMAQAQRRDVDVRCVLVIGGNLPDNLVAMKNMLGFQVIENVRRR